MSSRQCQKLWIEDYKFDETLEYSEALIKFFKQVNKEIRKCVVK